MNKLEQLIKELCPNGVEYKKLSDIATVARGVRVVRDQLAETGDIPVYQNSIKPLGYHDKSNVKAYSAFVIGAGAAGEIGFSDVDFWAADDCYYFLCPDNLNNRYLYFVLMKNQPLIISRVRKASIPRLSRTVIENLVIPVPPLEVQAEIVKILDEYSTSVTALQQELEKELTARKKQYEYYRDLLLDFGVHGGGASECEWRTLGAVCTIKGRIGFRGYTRNDMVEKGQGAISFSPANIINHTVYYNDNTYISWEKYEESPEIMVEIGDVLLCKTGSTLGKTAIIDYLPEKATINPQLVVLKNIHCNSRFLKYFLTTFYFQNELQKRKGLGSVPNISQKELGDIMIPIPPAEEQKRIVSILDRFDKICNDISEGLPAEIEARRKQYEYYRDKLLSFEERKNA